MKICTVEGCDKKRAGWGMCQMHYKRMKKTGTTDAPVRPTLSERFFSKVEKTDTCWNWTGSKNRAGYGNIAPVPGSGGSKLSHRVSYEMAFGPIPDGMDIDHKCHNHACVNPAHLRATSRKENMENLPGPNRNSTSGVLGVTWSKMQNAWKAQVMHHRKNYNIGYYSTIAEAEAAVIAKRLELFTHNDIDRRAA
jgi:hypothetical protein